MDHWNLERPFRIDKAENLCSGVETSGRRLLEPRTRSTTSTSRKAVGSGYEDDSEVWGPPIVPRASRFTGLAQRQPTHMGQFQTRITKPILPFLTMLYLRARRI